MTSTHRRRSCSARSTRSSRLKILRISRSGGARSVDASGAITSARRGRVLVSPSLRYSSCTCSLRSSASSSPTKASAKTRWTPGVRASPLTTSGGSFGSYSFCPSSCSRCSCASRSAGSMGFARNAVRAPASTASRTPAARVGVGAAPPLKWRATSTSRSRRASFGTTAARRRGSNQTGTSLITTRRGPRAPAPRSRHRPRTRRRDS